MGALPQFPLLTIEEFDRLEPPDGVEYELIEGVVYEVTCPRPRHTLLQERLQQLFANSTSGGRALPELGYEIPNARTKRRADIAFVTPDRLRQLASENVSRGAPDLVVEVISPSNSFTYVKRLATLCLRNRCREFWAVDEEDRSVTVWTSTSNVTQYGPTDTIPKNQFGIGPIQVREIFEGILPDQD